MKEAGLHFEDSIGEMWNARDGKLVKSEGGPVNEEAAEINQDALHKRLKEMEADMPLSAFLEQYFAGAKHAGFRNWVTKMAIGFDAADPEKISTFSLRDEWLGGTEWEQGRIKEGYGALLHFLESECKKNGVEIMLDRQVDSIEIAEGGVHLHCMDGMEWKAEKALVTLSVPTIEKISYRPAIPEKMAAIRQIGFGQVIKILLRFKSCWWKNALGNDLGRATFILTDGDISAWWTQYPEEHPVLTGWIPGPVASAYKGASESAILEMALASLSQTFAIGADSIQESYLGGKVFNWPADPLALGAYSYSAVGAEAACAEFRKPVDHKIFFAGEALFTGKETATVEGALASGLEAAEKMLEAA